MRDVLHFLEWATVVLARATMRLLPWRVVVAIGAAAGAMVYRLGVRRRVVLANLARAFPEWTASERRRVARQTYRNVGRTMIECLVLDTLSPDKMNQLVEQGKDTGFLGQLLAARKPFIVATGHLGNWELIGSYFARQGYPLKVFAKALHNPRLESVLLSTRRSLGFDVIYTGEGLKPALRHLREGGVLALVADQDARRAGVAIPFFGVPASTALGPAVFAYLARVPIVPVFAIRVGTMRHSCIVCPPIEPPVGEKREVVLEWLTRAHVAALEAAVRQYPEQYFWFHRRWKTPVEKLARQPAKAE